MNMNLRRGLWGVLAAFLGIGIIWMGGFLWVTKSSDWKSIEAVIQNDSTIAAELGGQVLKISPEFLGWSYGYREYTGFARFKAEVSTARGLARYRFHLMKSGQTWRVVEANRLL